MVLEQEIDRDFTVIFAISSDAQSSSLDSWKAKPNSLAKGCGIDVWDTILVTNSSIGEIKSLPRNIAVGIWCVVCC